MKKNDKILKSISDRLRLLRDGGELELSQKESITKAEGRLLHGARVGDKDELLAGVNDLCKLLLRRSLEDQK